MAGIFFACYHRHRVARQDTAYPHRDGPGGPSKLCGSPGLATRHRTVGTSQAFTEEKGKLNENREFFR